MHRGDYDFVMKELVALLYLFRDETTLLTNDAAWNILERGLIPRVLSEPKDHLTFDIRVPLLSDSLRYPESENHVLMTLSSIYLTRAFIADNPRHDPRVGALSRRTPRLIEAEPFVDPLLQPAPRDERRSSKPTRGPIRAQFHAL